MNKRSFLEIAVDDNEGNPLATFILQLYPPAKKMHHFCSFPAHERLGLDASADHEDIYPGALLYPEEIAFVESEKSREIRASREWQLTKKFREDKEELSKRFAYFHYDLAFSSIKTFLGREEEIHEVSRSRAKYNGYSSDKALLAFYIAKTCAPLCGREFNLSYRTVYETLQEYWKDVYSKAKQKLSEDFTHESEMIRKGGIMIDFEVMKHAATRIDGFNSSELQELKERYNTK